MNFMHARLSLEGDSVQLPGNIQLPLTNGDVPEFGAQDVTLGIRPEHFVLAEEGDGPMHLTVDHVEQLGADTLVHGHFGEDKASLTVRLPDIRQFKKNTILALSVPSQKLHLFDKQSGNRIRK
jgi:sn-glycerol 3-phosphate transport system ATP-binding protein